MQKNNNTLPTHKISINRYFDIFMFFYTIDSNKFNIDMRKNIDKFLHSYTILHVLTLLSI